MPSPRIPVLLFLTRRSPLTVSCRNVRGSTVPASETAKQQRKPVSPFALKPRDEPAYIKYTAEQKEWHWKGLIRHEGKVWPRDMPLDKYPLPDILQKTNPSPIDPDSEPFRQIYEGNEDGGNFSGADVVKDPDVWFWVQRILPSKKPPQLPRTDCRDRMPSGWIPPPITPPDRTYFVRRQNDGLFPVFKELVHRQKVFVKKIDDHVFDPHPDVITFMNLIDGEIRDLEMDLVNYIQSMTKKKVLSAVSEFEAKITFKGDQVEHIVKWLEDNGF